MKHHLPPGDAPLVTVFREGGKPIFHSDVIGMMT
jgi:hypothetical protein